MHAERLDPAALRTWAWTAHRLLREHRALIDALNVFPCADHDTGRNMLRFWEGFACALLAVPEDATAGRALELAAAESIDVEGNSVVLAFGWLSGLGDALADVPAAGPAHLAAALAAGAVRARGGVGAPVEGTMLTVFDAAARAAGAAVRSGASLAATAERIDREALAALAPYPVPRADPAAPGGAEDAGAFAARLLLHALTRTTTPAPPHPLRVPEAPYEVGGMAYEALGASSPARYGDPAGGTPMGHDDLAAGGSPAPNDGQVAVTDAAAGAGWAPDGTSAANDGPADGSPVPNGTSAAYDRPADGGPVPDGGSTAYDGLAGGTPVPEPEAAACPEAAGSVCELQAVVLADEAALRALASAPGVASLAFAEVPLDPGRWHLHLHTDRVADPLSVLGDGVTAVEHTVTPLHALPAGSPTGYGAGGRVLLLALAAGDFGARLKDALERGAGEVVAVTAAEDVRTEVHEALREARYRHPGLAAALVPCPGRDAAGAAARAFTLTGGLGDTVLAMYAAAHAP